MISFKEVVRRFTNMSITPSQGGATLVGDGKTLNITNQVEQPFLNDAEAKHIIKTVSPTSREYLKLKKKEAEKEMGRKLDSQEYRRLRDCVLAEVCSIELGDPRIREHHGLPPAS